jgi:hypothetical protein
LHHSSIIPKSVANNRFFPDCITKAISTIIIYNSGTPDIRPTFSNPADFIATVPVPIPIGICFGIVISCANRFESSP